MMDDNLRHLPRLGIAGAMRLYGMTARALRFYEERGLIEARRDRLNARFYDAAARRRLEWISRLRRAGVGLPQIEEVLEAETESEARAAAAAALAVRRSKLAAEMAALDAVLAEMERPEAPRRIAARA